MITAMPCGRCKEPVAPGAGEYTPDGELLCGKCLVTFQVGAAEAMEAASKRRIRVMAGVIVATIVIVPGVLFAVGAGQYVIKAMFGIGMAIWMLAWFALKEMGAKSRRGTLAPAMKRWYWRVFLGLFFGASLLMVLTGVLSKATGSKFGF